MHGDGSYSRVDKRGKEILDCQEALCADAIEAITAHKNRLNPFHANGFEPRMAPAVETENDLEYDERV